MKDLSQSDIVLVVDDSPNTVRLLTDVLDSEGMTVTVALDGNAALRIATRLRPNIILMDAVMPGMDGFECCRRLKAMSGFDDIPVIFMTGLSEPQDTVRGFQAGGADFVTKPIDVDSMLARINVHLSNARKIQSARRALDVIDQYLVATDISGDVRWFTPQAFRLLEQVFDRADQALRLPADVLAWLRIALARGDISTDEEFVLSKGGLSARIRFVGGGDQGEILLRVADASASDPIAIVRSRFNLTQREGEVLSWMVKGKSNRDIGAILSLSPRTIDKHLEGAFAKLNVENRTLRRRRHLQPETVTE